jgi:DNA polymerase-3 subunit gamma/tau
MDAASNNSVDNIRSIRQEVAYSTTGLKYKVYIIDEAHMLSASAFNALLKTLEEPPANVVFIMATTEEHKILPTILSRCIRFDFKLVPLDILTNHLNNILTKEGVKFEDTAVNVIARAGEGSVRDTLSIADRCVSFAGDNLTYQKVIDVLGVSERDILIKLTDIILKKDTGNALVLLDNVLSSGKRPLVFSNDLISYFRDLLLIFSLKEKAREIVVVKDDIFEQMKAQAVQENYAEILKAIEVLSGVEQELRYSAQPRIVLETAVIKIINEASLERRVEKLEEIVKNFPR